MTEYLAEMIPTYYLEAPGMTNCMAMREQTLFVEGTETIRVPAGEFETWKIIATVRSKGKDSKGNFYTGRWETTFWVALVSGKMNFVKIISKSSSGDKWSRELVSSSFQ